MKKISLSLIVLVAFGVGASAASSGSHSVSLSQDPLVMRLSKDEFRIAFGIDGERGVTTGCDGSIRYTVDWKTADGTVRSETKQVSFAVSPSASRTIAVDRQFFHTAEGGQATDVVKVRVNAITCRESTGTRSL